ncbi:MAG: Bug family tripartite tricarboxylate transporter substrate binding protein [Burkholderiales bacterium]
MPTLRGACLYLALIALVAQAGAALAQPYPSKPIRIIIGFAPGGGADINARLLAPKLTEMLGQPVVIENRQGAGANIAHELVAKAAPDGYTLLLTTPSVTTGMALYRKLPFDTLRDLTAVSMFSTGPLVLVIHDAVPAKTLQELIDLARRKPDSLTFGSAGTGTGQHLGGEIFKLRTKTDLLHVPYKGTGPALTAVLAGEVNMSFTTIQAASPHIKGGRLRALASAGAKRSELMPDVPTMAEAGVHGVVTEIWYGVLAPAATPREIVNLLSNAIIKTANMPEIRQRILEQGAEPVGNTAEAFGKILRDEVAQWTEVVRASGIQLE